MSDAYADMTDRDLLSALNRMAAGNERAQLALTALVDDRWFDVVSELRRRYNHRAVERLDTVREEVPHGDSGKMRSAHRVEIDPQRWKSLFFTLRIPLCRVGPRIQLSDGWASVVASRQATSLEAMDNLARELDMDFDDLVYAVGSDRERARVTALR